MFDIHSHILYGVDDGSKSLEQSVEMAKIGSSLGFTDIIATPHYIGNTKFNSNRTANSGLVADLQEKIVDMNLPTTLHLGNECFLESNLVDALINKKVAPIANTSYVLLEVPRNQTLFSSLIQFIFELQLKGYLVILAHPERYDFVIEDIDTLKELIKRDVLIQLNLPSLVGLYGHEVQDTARKMIEYNMVHFIGSDAHNEKGYERAGKALHILKKSVSKNVFEEITVSNPKAILKGNILYPEPPIKVEKKRPFWQFLKFNKVK